MFYCPYEFGIQTLQCIFESNKKLVEELKVAVATDKEIDEFFEGFISK